MRTTIGFIALAMTTPVLAAPPSEIHYEVPQDRGAQHVNVLVREFPVGGGSGWHTHPGVEIAYLISGEVALEQEGRPTRHLLPGDSFIVERGVAHNGVNLGKEPARLVLTYVVDRDAPVRSPAAPPHRH